jgi:hypothetical protein
MANDPDASLPREAIRPAWRATVLAYRANMRVSRHPSPTYDAALAAFREVLPDMPVVLGRRVRVGTPHSHNASSIGGFTSASGVGRT